MKEIIIELIIKYGLEIVLIALTINLLTTIIKYPIKLLAKKTNDSCKITRLIVFFPILIGYVICYLYVKYTTNNFVFNNEFARLWLTTSSLSITFYAVFEKMIFTKNKVLTNDDLNLVKESLNNLEKILKEITPSINEDKQINKLILRGKKNEKIASEEK